MQCFLLIKFIISTGHLECRASAAAAISLQFALEFARGVIGLLVDEVNPLVSVMKVDKARSKDQGTNPEPLKMEGLFVSSHQRLSIVGRWDLHQAPTESYGDIGGLEDQIMEMKEVRFCRVVHFRLTRCILLLCHRHLATGRQWNCR